ncbi:MAG: ribosome maturation factor RimM [Pseudomonadota bacterium]
MIKNSGGKKIQSLQNHSEGLFPTENAWVCIGQIGAPHGLRGELRFRSFTEQKEDVFQYQPWYLGKNSDFPTLKKSVTVEFHQGPKGWLIRIDGMQTRTEIENLARHYVFVPQSQLPVLEDDDYYWHELIGLKVFEISKIGHPLLLGAIQDMLETGSNDVIVIRPENSDTKDLSPAHTNSTVKNSILNKNSDEILIPYLMHDVVQSINLKTGEMHVVWPWIYDADDVIEELS